MIKKISKGIFLVCCIFFIVISMDASSTSLRQNLKAEEEKEESNSLKTTSLINKEQLELPEKVELPDGTQLPLSIPTIGTKALNGTKIDTQTTIVNPVFFIEFSDDTGEWVTADNLAKMQSNYNTGTNSLRNYYKKMSYGNVDVISDFFPKKIADGLLYSNEVVPFRSSFKRGYILPRSDSNPDGYLPSAGEDIKNPDSGRHHELKVIEEMFQDVNFLNNIYNSLNISKLELNTKFTAEFNFDWKFPLAKTIKDWEQISMDSCTFVFRGAMDANNMITWPHQFSYDNSKTSIFEAAYIITELNSDNSAKTYSFLNNYAVVTADNNTDLFSDNPDLGIITHEFFHIFEAPDLYRSSDKGMAVGKWDLMGWQQSIPQNLLQYTNAKFGIWKTPDFKEVKQSKPLSERKDLRVALAQYNMADYINSTAFKIVPQDESKGEYFMVEYRKKTDSGFDSSLDDSGLIVYRIHEDIPSTIGGGFCGITCGNIGTNLPEGYSADEVFVYRPNAESASLENAGKFDDELENAALPRTLNETKVHSIGKSLTEVPASAPFDNETLYFSDGTNSGIRIEQISDPGEASMQFSVLYGDEEYSEAVEDTEAPTIDETSLVGDALGTTWVKGDQEISVTIRDNVGLKEIMIFTMDGVMIDEDGEETENLSMSFEEGNHPTSEIITFKVRSNGTYTIFATDTSDNPSEPLPIEVRKVDNVVPNIQFEVGGSDSAKTLRMSADDVTSDATLLSGIKENTLKYAYLEPNANEENLNYDQTYQGTPIELEVDFHKKVCAKVEDNAGNIGKKCQVIGSANADTTPPVVGAITYNPTGWSNDDIVMSVPISDDKGLKSITVTTTDGILVKDGEEVTSDTRTLNASDTATSEDFVLRKNGTYTISVRDTSDNANASGNGQPVTINKIDNIAPIIDTFTYQANESGKMEVTATFVDKPQGGESGIKERQYQYWDNLEAPLGSDWLAFTSPMVTDKDQSYTGKFCLRSEDNAGNLSEVECKSFQSTDQDKPVLDPDIDNLVDINSDSSGWTNATSLALKLHVSDEGSGIKSIEVTLNDSLVGTKYETTETIKRHEYNLTVSENGIYEVLIMDQDDNTLRTTFTINQFDRIGPVIDATTNAQATMFFIFPTNDLDVSFTTHDLPEGLHSGVKEIYYQLVAKGGSKPGNDITNPSWTKISPNDDLRVDSGYEGKLYAIAIDNAGNASALYEEEIKNEEPFLSSDATLSNITLSSGTLIPNFSANTISYRASVANRITSITMNAEANDEGATVGGKANEEVELVVGENVFEIPVTAEDGTTTKTYTIIITREQPSEVESSDASLSSITLSSGTLSPSFDPAVVAYRANVASGVSSLSITAIPTNRNAIVEGDANHELSLAVGENVFDIDVTAEDGTEKSYTITITRATPSPNESSDATLSNILLSSGTLSPSFSPDTTSYHVSVANNVSVLSINATPSEEHARISGDVNQPLNLEVGVNTFSLLVSAQDETTLKYTITITRSEASVEESSDARLSSLTLSSGTLSPSFDPATTTYRASVASSVSSLTITAVPSDVNAVVAGDANKQLTLKEGVNNFTIDVTAEDGTNKSYNIDITRLPSTTEESNNANLSYLHLSIGTLSPSFDPNTLSYRADVANSVSKVTLNATASDASATLSGSANKTVDLAVGVNTFKINVTAEDGTLKTYTIMITRGITPPTESGNANLSSLSISEGNLSPSFKESIRMYRATVKNSVHSITLNAVASDQSSVVSKDANRPLSLQVGENTFEIMVTAKNKEKQTYTVIITREANITNDVKEIKSKDQKVSMQGNFDESFSLISEVKKIEEVKIAKEFEKDYSLEDVFDIYVNKDGKRFDIEEEVTVRIQLNDELKGRKDLLVAYIKEDGSYDILATTVYDDYVEFTTDHFSTYAIVSKNEANSDDVKTGDDRKQAMLCYVILGGCALGFLFTFSRRRFTKE